MSALIILAITIAGPRIGIVATTSVLIAAQFALATSSTAWAGSGWSGSPSAGRACSASPSCAPAPCSRCDGERPAPRARARAPVGALLRADADRATAEGGSAGSRARARVGGGRGRSSRRSTTRGTSSSAFRPPADGRTRRSWSSRRTSTWSASAIRPARSTRARAGSTCVVDGDWVRANGTTLGADNGIGVAAALAVADDPTIEHGPLELLFTVSEEQGLDGAKALDASLVSGRLLLNLDGTSDDALTIGSPGATTRISGSSCTRNRRSQITSRVASRSRAPGAVIRVGTSPWAAPTRSKCSGACSPRAPVRLGPIEGGVSRNALPRSAHAVVAVDVAAEEGWRSAVESELATIVREYTGYRRRARPHGGARASSERSRRPRRRGACSTC